MNDVRSELGLLARQSLAHHLGAAGRVDRLLRLFADDRWLTRRVEGRKWDGYREDVEIAWNTLLTRMADVEFPIAAAVRLALVRSSITASADVPVEILTAALRTGAVPAERVVAMADLLATPSLRAAACLEILAVAGTASDLARAVETRLIELARSDPTPGHTLLRALPELAAPARVAVVSALGERLTLTRELWVSDHRRREPGEEYVSPTQLLAVLRSLPEGPEPVLVAKVADSLVSELEIEVGGRGRPRRPESEPERRPTLMKRQYDDIAKATYDGVAMWQRIYTALEQLAAMLPRHPDRPGFLRRLMEALTALGDPDATSRLSAVYRPAASAEGLDWKVVEGGQVFLARHTDERERERLALIREELRRRNRGHMGEAPPAGPFADTLEELQRSWLAQAADLPYERFPHASPDAENPALDAVSKLLKRTGSPKFLAVLVAREPLTDEEILRLAEPLFLADELPTQVMLLDDNVSGEPRQPGELRAIIRVKTALLRVAMARAADDGVLVTAWDGIPGENLRNADFGLVLGDVLGLPIEEKRFIFWERAARTGPARIEDVPRLAGLALVTPYLDQTGLDRAFAHVLALSDPRRRRMGLAVLAPRLTAPQVGEALTALHSIPDAVEQTWSLRELAARLDSADERRRVIERLDAKAGTLISDGADFAEALMRSGQLDEPLILAALRAMDHNDRMDAIIEIASRIKDVLPPAIVAEAMALPVVDGAGRYPWRAHALTICCANLPGDLVAPAWQAAKELPRRLNIGDAGAWGWSWTYEYPLGGVALQFAARPDGPHREIFETACDLPWAPREEIFRALAEHADTALAGEILDVSLDRHRTYLALTESHPPFAVEEGVVTSSLEHFIIEREVQLAEIIAAVAAKLDAGHLEAAMDQCLRFTNEGPRAWLPGRLLKFVAPEDREPVLSIGFAKAVEFAAYDPRRLDLLFDLLPFVEEEVERRAAPVRGFLTARFPGFDGIIIDQRHASVLTTAEVEEYRRLMQIDQVIAARDEQAAMETILAPGLNDQRQTLIAGVVAEASVVPRARALTAMRRVLDPDHHLGLVQRTLDDLLRGEVPEPDLVTGLTAMSGVLEPGVCDQLVAVAAQLSGPAADHTHANRFFEVVYDDFDTARKGRPDYEDTRRNVVVRVLGHDLHHEKFNDVRAKQHGARIHLLRALAPRLTPAGLRKAADLIATLPEIERADGIAALLPAADGLRDELITLLYELREPFARFLALFTSQDDLSTDADPCLTELAWTTAMGFAEPGNQIACLLMLIGYGADHRTRWHQWVIDQFDRLDDRTALRVLNLLARIIQDDESMLGQLVGKAVTALRTPTSRRAGLLALGRLGCLLPSALGEHRPAAQTLVAIRLRSLAGGTRAELLRALATEAPGLTATMSPDEILATANAIHEVCLIWSWR